MCNPVSTVWTPQSWLAVHRNSIRCKYLSETRRPRAENTEQHKPSQFHRIFPSSNVSSSGEVGILLAVVGWRCHGVPRRPVPTRQRQAQMRTVRMETREDLSLAQSGKNVFAKSTV